MFYWVISVASNEISKQSNDVKLYQKRTVEGTAGLQYFIDSRTNCIYEKNDTEREGK